MTNSYALILSVCFIGVATGARAQGDTTRLNTGYTSLHRDLTQTITIKGEDLEKMPFANLSDAIAAWLYGAYTQPLTLLYIVDGSPVADVNSFSVFDIQEVTLVENASAMLYTGAGQQEVVLIRTRRGKEKREMRAAAQGGLVGGGTKGLSTDTRWYQQYYLGANANAGAFRFGASASWLRDVQPISGQYRVVTPDNLQRWRLHGYAGWQPDKHDEIELSVGYVPQTFGLGTDSVEQAYKISERNSASQKFFLPELRWHGEWLGGLTNQLETSYVQSVYRNLDVSSSVVDSNSAYFGISNNYTDHSSYHFYVQDRLAYQLRFGGWRIEPAMHIRYEHSNERFDYGGSYYYGYGQGNTTGNLVRAGAEWGKYHVYYYTPQLDIHYKNVFDLTGGKMIEPRRQVSPIARNTFFFVSTSFDVLRLVNEKSASGLAIFGSYAQREAPPLPGYQLSDLSYGYANYDTYAASSFSTTGYEDIYYGTTYEFFRFWVWDAGVRYNTWKCRLQVQANFERRNYELPAYVSYVPTGSNFTIGVEYGLVDNQNLLHLDIRATILQGAEADWQSGISATVIYSDDVSTQTQLATLAGYVGDLSPDPYSVTGGWVNRIRIRHFTGGLDVLYRFGEVQLAPGQGLLPAIVRRLDPVAIPNIYAGYQWNPGGKEIFVETRGLFRSNPSDLSQSRRYYTIGGKLPL